MQRCDPAPFYLFDEIDAALDPQYRTTVAQLLRKQSKDARSPAQFIITTFHPQVRPPVARTSPPPSLNACGPHASERAPSRLDPFCFSLRTGGSVQEVPRDERRFLPHVARLSSHTCVQIVAEADQLYGVAHTNRVSRVFVIDKEDAFKFLQVRCGRVPSSPCGAPSIGFLLRARRPPRRICCTGAGRSVVGGFVVPPQPPREAR